MHQTIQEEKNKLKHSFLYKTLCCGCGVCALICPRQAITMCPDEEGFLYPEVDVNKCVNCGLCEKKCAFKKNTSGRTKMSSLDDFNK